jgi:hypothetical protein
MNSDGEPGATAEQLDMPGVESRFHSPNWVAAIDHEWEWGHARVAGLLRPLWWDDLPGDTLELAGHATGWGMNLTGAYKFGGEKHERDALKLQYMVGAGAETYLNDNTFDVGPRVSPGNPVRPIVGVPLPVRSFTGYVEMYRGSWGGMAGYSMQDIQNSDGQPANAFSAAGYGTVTAIYSPTTVALAALEYQYGRRANFSDGWRFSDHRLQLTIQYRFSGDFRWR